MSAERVFRHQLRGNLLGQFAIQTAFDVDSREFGLFKLNICCQFFTFPLQVCIFRIGLGTDRNIFACGHGHCTRDQTGQSCHEYTVPTGFRGSNADDQAGSGNDTVIRAKDGGTKPANAVSAVEFSVCHKSFEGWPKMIAQAKCMGTFINLSFTMSQ